mgnify:CR=1 FL=1
MKRAIVTYAADAHEELLDVALPTYKDFAHRHGYEVIVGEKKTDRPPAWNKILLLEDALDRYEEVVWFDCDLIVVNLLNDFEPMVSDSATEVFTQDKLHGLVRHFEDNSEVPNSGVWRLRTEGKLLLYKIWDLTIFTNHGWWEQAALMTLMGYTVPPEGSEFPLTKCRCVHPTIWQQSCQFMRLCWNSHPNYRAEHPRIVHCSYPSMPQRLEVMRELVKNPHYEYPRYGKLVEDEDEGLDK